jgi:hypothetical protein
MTWNLFLDDERNPEDVTWAPWQVQERYRNEDWVIARSYGDAMVEILNRGFPKFVSFDHDLGDEIKYTGYDLAKQLVENDIISGDRESREGYRFSEHFGFYVHSKNPIGKANIENYIKNYIEFKRRGA